MEQKLLTTEQAYLQLKLGTPPPRWIGGSKTSLMAGKCFQNASQITSSFSIGIKENLLEAKKHCQMGNFRR